MIDTREASKLLGVTIHRVKQLIDEHDIPIEKKPGRNTRIKLPNQAFRQLLKQRGLGYERSVVTVGQEKGGVGKSLLTFNLAVNLSFQGARVLIVDLDPEACITNLIIRPKSDDGTFSTVFEVLKHDLQFKDVVESTNYQGIDIVGCKGLARRAERLVSDQNPKKILREKMSGLDHYDVIMFDIPPTFSRLISSAYLTSDLVLMPTFPDSWSIESLQLTIDDITEDCRQFDSEPPDIKILMNKFLSDRKASKDALDVLSKNYGEYLLPYQIKESAALQNFVNNGVSLFEASGNLEIKDSFRSICHLISPLESGLTEDRLES